MSGPQTILRRLVVDPWRGHQRLWVVFWFYWLAAPILIERFVWSLPLDGQVVVPTTLCANSLYAVFSCIALWRCAPNTDYAWLGYAARALAVINLIAVPLAIYLTFFGDFGNVA